MACALLWRILLPQALSPCDLQWLREHKDDSRTPGSQEMVNVSVKPLETGSGWAEGTGLPSLSRVCMTQVLLTYLGPRALQPLVEAEQQ